MNANHPTVTAIANTIQEAVDYLGSWNIAPERLARLQRRAQTEALRAANACLLPYGVKLTPTRAIQLEGDWLPLPDTTAAAQERAATIDRHIRKALNPIYAAADAEAGR